jgi:prophage regulatory protein
MYLLPEIGFLRLPQIIGDPTADPPLPPIIPVKKSCWWQGVKTGRFPPPVRWGGCTMWRVEDIRALVESAKNCDMASQTKGRNHSRGNATLTTSNCPKQPSQSDPGSGAKPIKSHRRCMKSKGDENER